MSLMSCGTFVCTSSRFSVHGSSLAVFVARILLFADRVTAGAIDACL
eukprot:SAG11_NODE_32395_length_284_cov_0.448649_1_plen_46_part_10